ncbi:MAG: GNAT family N-acetyltransferase [Pyrinomonadaceae bacterium]|nr:GNAT family N-acetyltransferase [Pyrinomonadaceae bacterium]
MPKFEIVPYSDDWAGDFASLNYEWIGRYFSVERHDSEILDDPRRFVIEPGGEIFIAVVSGLAAGAVALIPSADGSLELTKMAVSPEFQGMGIGDGLMARCIEYANEKGTKSIWLESHTKLAPALSLYRKHGFVETPKDPNSLYSRADIRMQLAI